MEQGFKVTLVSANVYKNIKMIIVFLSLNRIYLSDY